MQLPHIPCSLQFVQHISLILQLIYWRWWGVLLLQLLSHLSSLLEPPLFLFFSSSSHFSLPFEICYTIVLPGMLLYTGPFHILALFFLSVFLSDSLLSCFFGDAFPSNAQLIKPLASSVSPHFNHTCRVANFATLIVSGKSLFSDINTNPFCSSLFLRFAEINNHFVFWVWLE
jgi:hypothetical protein